MTSFTFGPFVSRFWMLRKHINLMDVKVLEEDAPFYAWNCLTLSIANLNDIYIIIKNEQAMADFIKMLIFKMDTLDGRRGTATLFKKTQLE